MSLTPIDKDNVLNVVTRSGTSPEIISLLEQTIFGTKGKVRYRQKHIVDRMTSQTNIEFIQIQKRDRILGTTGVVTRSTTGFKNGIKSLYIRYLSVNNPFRKNEKKQGARKPSKRTRVANQLKTLIGDQITGHFEKPVIEANEKAAFYAYVESENFNSKELCINLGFYPTRKVATVLFSRFFPKTSSHISLVQEKEKELIQSNLAKCYSNHSFYFEDQLFESGSYLVLKKENTIVAGIRCKAVNWEIVEVPGFTGFLMQNILPYLPLTNRLFNPKNLNFLAFDYSWSADHNIQHILELMEHACSTFGIYMGMYWGDLDDKTTTQLVTSKKLGFLNSIKGTVTAEVMLRFINMDELEQKELLDKPVFVSALDMT